MSEKEDDNENTPADSLDQAPRRRGLAGELFAWVKDSGKWWLIPILLGLLLVGILVALGSSVFAPFIYPLF